MWEAGNAGNQDANISAAAMLNKRVSGSARKSKKRSRKNHGGRQDPCERVSPQYHSAPCGCVLQKALCVSGCMFLENDALLPSLFGAWGRPATETSTLVEEGCSVPSSHIRVFLSLKHALSLHVQVGRL